MMESLATAIVTLTIIGLTYLVIRYRGQRDDLAKLHSEAMQLVVNGAAARRQAEQEFINLKAVVEAWNNRPIMANLTDAQIQFIISSLATIYEAKSKEPSRLN